MPSIIIYSVVPAALKQAQDRATETPSAAGVRHLRWPTDKKHLASPLRKLLCAVSWKLCDPDSVMLQEVHAVFGHGPGSLAPHSLAAEGEIDSQRANPP